MQIIKSTLIVGVTTFASRILGYLRDAMIAAALGATPLNDAFLIAFRLANLFRSLFGEGAFHSAFVPIFAGLIKRRSLIYAKAFAARVQSLLFLALFLFCTLIVVFMPAVISLTVPGIERSEPGHISLIIELSRITFPYLLLISIVAFYGGILNSIGKFFPFASISVWFNIILIIFIFNSNFFETKAHALCYGLIIAGIIELIWILFFAKVNGVLIPLKAPKMSKELKDMLKRLGAGTFGSGILQINVWIDLAIASFIPGAISFLYFADRIMQLPLAVIGTAASFTLLPALAKSFQSNDNDSANATQNTMLRFSMFFAIPASFGLIFLAYEIVDILFRHGEFTRVDAQNTSNALKCFAIGLPGYILNKIFISYLHSHGDVKTPVKVGAASLLINICLSLILIVPLKHSGIALASALVATLNAGIFIFICSKYKSYSINKQTTYSILQSVTASIIMTAGLYIIFVMLPVNSSILNLFLGIIFGFLLYISSYYLIRKIC